MENEFIILERIYSYVFSLYTKGDTIKLFKEINEEEKKYIDVIILYSESRKAALTVLIASAAHKLLNPKQDIRLHQANLDGGYSGRSIDTRHVTPFMKKYNFPAMAESGWLTRSFEQNMPFDSKYRGKITPPILKESFLFLIDKMQSSVRKADIYLRIIICMLIEGRDKKDIVLSKPSSLSINKIISYLKDHFEYKYKTSGASRLPVLAIYAIYQCFMAELKRFEGKSLKALEEHTTADARTGAIGDIEIIDREGLLFEGVEIKHGILITPDIIQSSYEKFKTNPVKRYYILSTANVDESARDKIDDLINTILNAHGCQVIVNGIYPSLWYYLRLINDVDKFIHYYVENIKADKVTKYEHKDHWNKLVSIS